MNKTFIGILLAVCVLGMALALFSERLRREPENARTPQSAAAETQLPDLAASNTPANMVEPVVREAPETAIEPVKPGSAAAVVEKEENEAARQALGVSKIPSEPEIAPPEPPQPEIPPAKPAPAAQVPPVPPAVKPEPVPAKPAPEKSAEPVPAPQKAQPKPALAQNAAPTKGGKITNFVVFARDNGATIRMGGDGKIKYSSMTLENPNRVVVDMDGAWAFPERLPIPKNDIVSGIRVGKNGDKTRVVIDLKAKPRLSRMVEGQNGNSLDVRVDK